MKSRYFIEYESSEEYSRLKALAAKRGVDVEASDDWFEPPDIVEYFDAGDTLDGAREVAKRVAKKSRYGQARIFERVPHSWLGSSGAWHEEYNIHEIETVEA